MCRWVNSLEPSQRHWESTSFNWSVTGAHQAVALFTFQATTSLIGSQQKTSCTWIGQFLTYLLWFRF